MKGARGAHGGMGTFAVVAVALAGLALALSPLAERLDAAILDLQWSVLRKFDARPVANDIIIVGVDDATAASIAEPPPLWHASLGMALVRIASAKPRAIVMDLPLPERSFDSVRPGLDRALLVGLAAARQNGPFVVSVSIDARTRAARPIHAPFLAVLEEQRLGLGLIGRDADGAARRYALAIPTEDGAFPTLVGRLCEALAQSCDEGLIDFALGVPHRQIPLQRLLATNDVQVLERLFRDRIVLIGEARRFGERIPAPVNLAGWEPPAPDTPGVVIHAQALRTALSEAAPREASRPVVLLLVLLAALVVLMRDWRLAAVTAILAAGLLFVGGVLLLRGGLYLPVGAALATLAVAVAARAWTTFSSRFVLRPR